MSPWSQRRNNRESGEVVFDPVALLTAFGSTKRADYVDEGEAWKEYDSLRDAEPVQQAATALLSVAQVWVRRLNLQSSYNVAAQASDARRMCQILGLDFAAIDAEAVKVIPQPKSWASLNEGRTPSGGEATCGQVEDHPPATSVASEDDTPGGVARAD